MDIVLYAIISILWFVICYAKIRNFLHIIQLEGYSNTKFKDWIMINGDKVFKNSDKYFFIMTFFITLLFFLLRNNNISILILYLVSILYIVLDVFIASKRSTPKKPFIYTKRAKRLIFFTIVMVLLSYVINNILVLVITKKLTYLPICVAVMNIFYYFSIYYVLLGNTISIPIENKINKRFFNMANKKIRSMTNLKIVDITGSYGKTSAKFITATILSEKFKVLRTPESYNTPMGISKVINNDLNDQHEIFIAELGATKPGDINEVSYLTNPSIGVLTSIGPCHLQSFGSIDNISNTKYELIEYLPDNGTAIFNYDNPYVARLADKTNKNKILYAVDNIENADVFTLDIAVSENGSTFNLCIKDLGCIECQTFLLGKHNILNILAGASVAKALGMSLEQIKAGISKVTPISHRLELIDPKTGVLVIDDAYNSNPDGAGAALNVLNEFKNRRKIIITPGMVELGELEIKENEKFGEKISGICDIVILVGRKRTEPIFNGLRKSKYDMSNVFVVNSINESTDVLKDITKPGDIILYENDLPDTYDEN